MDVWLMQFAICNLQPVKDWFRNRGEEPGRLVQEPGGSEEKKGEAGQVQ